MVQFRVELKEYTPVEGCPVCQHEKRAVIDTTLAHYLSGNWDSAFAEVVKLFAPAGEFGVFELRTHWRRHAFPCPDSPAW